LTSIRGCLNPKAKPKSSVRVAFRDSENPKKKFQKDLEVARLSRHSHRVRDLDALSWVRLAIWLAIGLAIYFGYGARHSRIMAVD
jgi:C-terminus of AA_permease